MISENLIGAIAVALITGIALTLSLNAAFRNIGMALTYALPATLVLGVVLSLMATDKIKLGGKKPPKGE